VIISVTVVQSFKGLQFNPKNHDKNDLPQSLRDLREIQEQKLYGFTSVSSVPLW